MEEKRNVPKIRFPGFTEDWEQRKLGEIADKVTTKNAGTQYIETLTNSAEFGIISQRDFFDHDVSNIDNIDGYYIVEDDSFVYNPRISSSAPVGPINRNKLGRTGVMSPLYTVFKTHDVDSEYLEWFFKSTRWHDFMKFNGDSGARSDRFSIKDAVFFEMPIPIPDIEEQRKIGKYMTELDNLITLHQRKCDETKKLKKYMLQKMFPKNGERFPEIRFEGFTDAWEQRKLIDICDYVDYRGKTPTKTEDGIFLVTAKNVKDGYIDYEASKEYISDEDYEEVMHRGTPKLGDVLITTEAPCGNVAQVNRTDIALAQRIIKYRGHENVIDNTFLKHYLLAPEFQTILMAKSSGGTVKGIKGSILHQQEVKYPQYEEQVRIGNYLDNLDNLITLHQRKCDAIKELKKGLLQQMLV